MSDLLIKMLFTLFLSINLSANLELNSIQVDGEPVSRSEYLNKSNRKKKKEKAAAIFWGLANAVASIAQAANTGGSSPNPAEGITNFIANIFNTAAQISQIEANHARNPEFIPLRKQLVFSLLVNIVESLYNNLQEDKGRFFGVADYPLLKELSSISESVERISWLSEKILENGFVQSFLDEALDFLEYFLHQKADDFMDFLRERLLIKDKGDNKVITVS